MSSEGSGSARSSHFGLYRAVDARADRFLQLSKRRQIKQGCVCAAVASAVTVVVVIAIILIYEYNVATEAKRRNLPHWIDLVNNSANDTIIREKFNKENIVLDRTTLKLLPILLQALSRYGDKKVEESTSPYPLYEIRDTTDSTYIKNIFADTRNWMKMPSSRVYAIEYKTSPIVYFKSPTRNVDYFTKIRKIRDYQRMLNYVDKMINEKNSGTTQPMNSITEKPIKNTINESKRKMSGTKKVNRPKSTTSNIKTSTPKNLIEEKITNCKCPHKVDGLVQKLLSSIQMLLTYLSRSNLKGTDSNNCTATKDIQVNPIQAIQSTTVKSTTIKSTTIQSTTITYTTIKPMTEKITTERTTTENYDMLEPEVFASTPFKTFLNKHKYTIDFANNFDVPIGNTINTILSLIKPNYKKNNHYLSNSYFNEELSITNSYARPSIIDVFTEETSTESFKKNIVHPKIDIDKTEFVTKIADYILNKNHISSDISSTSPTFPETHFAEVYDEYSKTTTNLLSNFQNLDTHSLELVKSKFIPQRKQQSEEEKPANIFKGVTRKYDMPTNTSQMRKFGNLAANYSDRPESFLKMFHRFAPTSKANTIKTISPTNYTKDLFSTTKRLDKRNNYLPTFNHSIPVPKSTTTRTISSTNYAKYLTTIKIKKDNDNLPTLHQPKVSEQTTVKTITSTTDLNPQTIEKPTEENLLLKNETSSPKLNTEFKDITFKETERVWEENISQETLKQIEEAIRTLNKNVNIITDDQYQLELVKLEQNTISPNSMIPNSRPIYLEMQRTDWKQDDNHDFDNNFTYD